MISICISLIAISVKQICLLIICIYSLEWCLQVFLSILKKMKISVFLLFSYKNSLCIVDRSPLSKIWLANIFSHSGLSFHFMDGVVPVFFLQKNSINMFFFINHIIDSLLAAKYALLNPRAPFLHINDDDSCNIYWALTTYQGLW